MSLSISNAKVTEGSSGTTPLSFQLTLAAAYPLPVSVSYQTSDGSASAPADYAAANGTVTFQPGQTTQQLAVNVVADTAVEQDETFTVTLSNPVNAILATGTATGTIVNDDFAPKDGHYSGTTSQGKGVAFDVSGGATIWSNFVTAIDITCQEAPVSLLNQPFDLSGTGAPLAPDWSWNINTSVTDENGTVSIAFNSKLTPPGNATGTFRLDMALNTTGGVVHCSTGTVNWNATTP